MLPLLVWLHRVTCVVLPAGRGRGCPALLVLMWWSLSSLFSCHEPPLTGETWSSPWTCLSISTQKAEIPSWAAEVQICCCPATAALPCLCPPCVSRFARRILTAAPQPDLSVGRPPAKLEINFRSSGGFTRCNRLSAGNMIQFPESLGTEQTVQSNSFQSILTWAGDEPIWKRWKLWKAPIYNSLWHADSLPLADPFLPRIIMKQTLFHLGHDLMSDFSKKYDLLWGWALCLFLTLQME